MTKSYHKSLQVTPNFYSYIWMGMGNNCNTSLIANVLEGERPHVLVDPGHIKNEMHEPCVASLVSCMEQDGFALDKIGLVIMTHSHPDHFESAEDIVRKSGAMLTMSREEAEFYRGGCMMLYRAFGNRPPEVEPFFYLTEGQLSLGKDSFDIRVLLTPGHTPGSVSLYLERDRILITGDVVFFNSVGRTDFIGGNPVLLSQSINRLSQLDAEHVVPGHSTEPGMIISGRDKVARNFTMVRMFFSYG